MKRLFILINIVLTILILQNCSIFKEKNDFEISILKNENNLFALFKNKQQITEFKYTYISDFQNDYSNYSIESLVNDSLSKFGFLDLNGNEYPIIYENDKIRNIIKAPYEIPDSSHLLGNLHYKNQKWTLEKLLNHNLNAFSNEPLSYPRVDVLDKVCIGYGIPLTNGNYSEDYMYKHKEWSIFKEKTIYKIISDENLRTLTWNWIKPYYKEEFKNLNPAIKKTYKDCFQYLANHMETFNEEKYLKYLKAKESEFAKKEINGEINNKRKLSAFVDRLILIHKTISKEDAKKWIIKINDEIIKW